ncbi:MAG: peptidyl-prolyl cis-trans isomerase D [Polaribacter sp.]|jgi:peptidyl-prolyl cis-trans isomerase D
MALISSIRKHNWILIVAIGFALAAFIMMDMFSGEKSVFGGQPTTIGTIDGTKVEYNDLIRAESALYPNSSGDMYSRRNTLWDYFVEEALVNEEADALGLHVGKEEMMDLQYGANISPIMQARFRDPATGQVNRAQLTQLRGLIESNGVQDAIAQGQLAPSFPHYWAHQMREVKKDRLQSKLSTLVQKSIFTPTWMAEMVNTAQTQRVDFNFVKVPFDVVAGVDAPSDGDLQNYLNANKAKYINDEETRKVAFVTYNVAPTKEDSTNIYNNVAILATEFRTTDNDSTFVDNNYGTINGTYFTEGQLGAISYKDTLMKAPVGAVVGPYLNGKTYTIAKVLDRKIIPDSVKSRHILINAKSEIEYQQAFAKIDSLQKLIEAKTNNFDELARAFSQGPTSVKGGDLGFAGPNAMVKPFNDLIFFQAETGKVYPVVTQFGVHLVEVMDYKYIKNEQGVRYASVSETIVPSQKTQKVAYNKALDFVANNSDLAAMTKAAESTAELTMEMSPALKANDFFVGTLGAGQGSRDLVKWAFEQASIGDRSTDVYEYQDQVDYFDNKYIIAALASVQKAGVIDLANVREEILPLVTNMKKGDAVKAKISGQSLSAIATSYKSKVDTVKSANFNSSYLPVLGSEPKVLAAAANMEPNSVSQPIVGTNGIYIVKVSNRTIPTVATDMPSLRRQASGVYSGQVNRQLLQAMRKEANITDNRSTFY